MKKELLELKEDFKFYIHLDSLRTTQIPNKKAVDHNSINGF